MEKDLENQGALRALLGLDGAADMNIKKTPQSLKPMPLPKRFYETVSVRELPHDEEPGMTHFAILLDGKSVKTPARNVLALPNRALAELISDEFRIQQKVINPALMPVTRLANTVLDGIAADMQPVIEDILRYISCDMVFYRAGSPAALVKRQTEGWDKALDWAMEKMGAEFTATEGVIFITQKPEALAAASSYLRRWLEPKTEVTPFAVAALHLMTSLSGSALLALMAAAGDLEVKEAWRLANLDEDWTAEQWGRDEEAMKKRAAHERDFYAAAAVLEAVKKPA